MKRGTELLLIGAQNNAIRTYYIKEKNDCSQQNSKCSLRCDKDEAVNHIIREFSKLAQKEYKSRHDWLAKEIHKELSKKLKFNHAVKWYMYKWESLLENETHKILWDFEIQSDYLIMARWPNLESIKKELVNK